MSIYNFSSIADSLHISNDQRDFLGKLKQFKKKTELYTQFNHQQSLFSGRMLYVTCLDSISRLKRDELDAVLQSYAPITRKETLRVQAHTCEYWRVLCTRLREHTDCGQATDEKRVRGRGREERALCQRSTGAGCCSSPEQRDSIIH